MSNLIRITGQMRMELCSKLDIIIGVDIIPNLEIHFQKASNRTGLSNKTLWRIYHDHEYVNIRLSTYNKIDDAFKEKSKETEKYLREHTGKTMPIRQEPWKTSVEKFVHIQKETDLVNNLRKLFDEFKEAVTALEDEDIIILLDDGGEELSFKDAELKAYKTIEIL